MIRWLFRLILLVVLAALTYGLWLMYQEKPPEQKQEVRDQITQTFKETGRILGKAVKKTVEKGQQIYQGHRPDKESD